MWCIFNEIDYLNLSNKFVTPKSLKSKKYLFFKLISKTQTLLNQGLVSLKSAW
ncbi:hypothetical protein SPB_1926 [Streptococcus parauberis NCFD 2020]|uniref:Uncharacterized protein n=1 Tax=Streptococcus parauberis NCFD 2020 TaxID=873447 RepID=F1Z0T2_9STRE|nr:hypothetical protein SPB_1926 [Streptococcus parauberis NCFD 2020]